ncbi:hypothetical protein ANCCAN_21982 [Ancylostoma caninum]|uniref:Uncharacterized protein n=1 Tax=Ancylostoma caninum TaxID=29170 RepID=A0A368FN06_ANCCA|nr:hypothetical protein ANCCAN_21982 [Ancylostoma caninum]
MSYPIPADFGCQNSLISDEWRKYVLTTHNKLRRNLAIGQVKTANSAKTAPMAFNMNELRWDCDVEKYASAAMCSATALSGYYTITQTFKNAKGCNVTEETSKLLKEWWNESNAVDLVDENVQYTDEVKQKAQKFAFVSHNNLLREDLCVAVHTQMAYALVRGFACTYGTCAGSTGLKLYCVYRRKELAKDEKIYNPTKSLDKVCTQCASKLPPDERCIDRLCQQEYTSRE